MRRMLLLARTVLLMGQLVALMRDGTLQGADGKVLAKVEAPRALAALPGGRFAVAAGDALVIVDGKAKRRVPGAFVDVRGLAAPGARLCAALESGAVVEIDLKTGAKRELQKLAKAPRLAADGEVLLAELDGEVVEVGGAGRWKLVGRPLAIAAAAGRVFAATREGPLRQLDRASGRQRELGFGSWWATLALAADDTSVFVATQAGKLWRIDVGPLRREALAMTGFESTLALAVSR